jgi:hypothetical protein
LWGIEGDTAEFDGDVPFAVGGGIAVWDFFGFVGGGTATFAVTTLAIFARGPATAGDAEKTSSIRDVGWSLSMRRSYRGSTGT